MISSRIRRSGRIVIGAFTLAAASLIVSVVHPTTARSASGGGGVHPDKTCATSGPCQIFINTGSGPGVKSTAVGAGVTASTSFVNSGPFDAGSAGLIGTDASTSGTGDFGVFGSSTHDAGVFGKSSTYYGVIGSSPGKGVAGIAGQTLDASATSGAGAIGVYGLDPSTDGGTLNTGVEGFSTTGTGVSAFTTSGTAVLAESASGPGMNAFTGSAGAAVFGTTFNPSASDLYSSYGISGGDSSSDGGKLNGGVFGSSSLGFGVFGMSPSGVGMLAKGATALRAQAAAVGSVVFQGENSSGTTIAKLDDLGNLHLSGKIFTSGSCKAGCIPQKGVIVRPVTYVASQSLPTVEDFGEAQLSGGHAYVGVDRAFGNLIDSRTAYMVFITPEGDTNGLYVTNRTPNGFEVKENRGGRSTVGFAYRIVAKPYGDQSPRLPMEAMPAAAGRAPTIPRAPHVHRQVHPAL